MCCRCSLAALELSHCCTSQSYCASPTFLQPQHPLQGPNVVCACLSSQKQLSRGSRGISSRQANMGGDELVMAREGLAPLGKDMGGRTRSSCKHAKDSSQGGCSGRGERHHSEGNEVTLQLTGAKWSSRERTRVQHTEHGRKGENQEGKKSRKEYEAWAFEGRKHQRCREGYDTAAVWLRRQPAGAPRPTSQSPP